MSSTQRQIHTLGIDDAPFPRDYGGDVLVVGVVMRGVDLVDGVLSTWVRKDGRNATAKLATMIGPGGVAEALRCIFLDGIAVGGFNVVDLPELAERCGRPVVAVTRREPDMASIRRALKGVRGGEHKWRSIERAGPIHHAQGICFQFAGATESKVRSLLSNACHRSKLPESVRLAHLIGAGITSGRSRGRA